VSDDTLSDGRCKFSGQEFRSSGVQEFRSSGVVEWAFSKYCGGVGNLSLAGDKSSSLS
jgi:hypothetical protein